MKEINIKICKECLEEKELSDFYKHPQWFLWVLPRCKECIKRWRRTERERIMARVINKKRYSKIERKEYMKIKLKEFRIKYPEKYLAQRLVARFLKKNKQYKKNICYVSWIESRIELHHFDYTKPNYVIPCTHQIHSDFHSWKITEIKNEWILILPFEEKDFIFKWRII